MRAERLSFLGKKTIRGWGMIKRFFCARIFTAVFTLVIVSSLFSRSAGQAKPSVLMPEAEWNKKSLDERVDILVEAGNNKARFSPRDKRLYNRRYITTGVLMVGRTVHESLSTAIKTRADLKLPPNLANLSNLVIQGGFLVRDTVLSRKFLVSARNMQVKWKCVKAKDKTVSAAQSACAAAQCTDPSACMSGFVTDLSDFLEPPMRFGIGGVRLKVTPADFAALGGVAQKGDSTVLLIPSILETIWDLAAPNSPSYKILRALSKSTDVSFVILRKAGKMFKSKKV